MEHRRALFSSHIIRDRNTGLYAYYSKKREYRAEGAGHDYGARRGLNAVSVTEEKSIKMHVAMGADHGGLALKNELVAHLGDRYEIVDLGAHNFDPDDDYPDFTREVARAVISGGCERGMIICGSGVGAAISANKVPGIRACLCHDTYSAHQGVEHDDMNVLCLGARVIGVELAKEIATTFLEARFSGEERHRRRLQKVLSIEREALQGERPETGKQEQ